MQMTRNTKWLPYSSKLTSGYEMANKPKIKNKKIKRMVKKKGKERENNNTF